VQGIGQPLPVLPDGDEAADHGRGCERIARGRLRQGPGAECLLDHRRAAGVERDHAQAAQRRVRHRIERAANTGHIDPTGRHRHVGRDPLRQRERHRSRRPAIGRPVVRIAVGEPRAERLEPAAHGCFPGRAVSSTGERHYLTQVVAAIEVTGRRAAQQGLPGGAIRQQGRAGR
jgi:hypothetical protein